MTKTAKARAVGINHVAIEVGDIDAALAFYGAFLQFELRSRSANAAFIDLGDQFLALSKSAAATPDDHRHFGLVVDDKDAVRRAVEAMGVAIVSDRFLDFRDPWGNRIEIIGYGNIQFTKAHHVLAGMGLAGLAKTERALGELAAKGMAPGEAEP